MLRKRQQAEKFGEFAPKFAQLNDMFFFGEV